MQTLHSLPESPVTHNLFDEGTRWRVVIVDAHTVMREMLRMTLNAYSDLIVVVGEAFDGEEAVEQATRYQPDLVLMDVNLPQDSSLEATRAIKRLLPDSVIVGMSAEYTPHQYNAMIAAGAVAFVRKEDAAELLFKTIVYSMMTYRPCHAFQ